jgi:hypothetical protein
MRSIGLLVISIFLTVTPTISVSFDDFVGAYDRTVGDPPRRGLAR